jgi:hypothetical protein
VCKYNREGLNVFYRFLIDSHNADISALDNLNRTPLHYVQTQSVIDVFLENNSDIEQRDIYGNTALMTALILKNQEAIEVFLDRGAKTNAINYKQQTILHFAAQTLGTLTIQSLHKSDPQLKFDSKDTDGNTPLLFALKSTKCGSSFSDNAYCLIKWFKSKGVNIYTLNNNNESFILHHAISTHAYLLQTEATTCEDWVEDFIESLISEPDF